MELHLQPNFDHRFHANLENSIAVIMKKKGFFKKVQIVDMFSLHSVQRNVGLLQSKVWFLLLLAMPLQDVFLGTTHIP